MARCISFLLLIFGFTRIYSRSTISKVSVKAGRSLTIPCSYEDRYTAHLKYLCKGPSRISCLTVVKTNHPGDTGKFAISDDKTKRIFTVTINHLADKDTNNYWCAVEIDFGADIYWPFTLLVNTASHTLYADHQEITGFIGDSMRTWFHSQNPGETKWCRLDRHCTTGSSSAPFGGTKVAIDENPSHNFTVTMSGLRTDSSGWYYFVKGDLQMPVHLTVTAKPSTTTLSPTTHHTTVSGKQAFITFRPGEQSSVTVDLKSLIIPLILLVFIVIMSLIAWFVLKLHHQRKVMAEEEVTYSDVTYKSKTSVQAGSDPIYCNTDHMRGTSDQMSGTDVDVTYSLVVTKR